MDWKKIGRKKYCSWKRNWRCRKIRMEAMKS